MRLLLSVKRKLLTSGGGVDTPSTDQQQMLLNALDLLYAALGVLDRAAAPAQIGAHVDLAANQLADAISSLGGEPQLAASEQNPARH